jgi:hypothetical protein
MWWISTEPTVNTREILAYYEPLTAETFLVDKKRK